MNWGYRLGDTGDSSLQDSPCGRAAEVRILLLDNLSHHGPELGIDNRRGDTEHPLKRIEEAMHGHTLVVGFIDAIDRSKREVGSVVFGLTNCFSPSS